MIYSKEKEFKLAVEVYLRINYSNFINLLIDKYEVDLQILKSLCKRAVKLLRKQKQKLGYLILIILNL